MIKNVIQQNDPRLRAENEVAEISKELTYLIKDLLDTMEATGLSGIAAPQIAINKKVYICRDFRKIDEEGDKKKIKEIIYVFINPKILSTSEATDEWHEGCGSVESGKVFGIVERPKRVTIEAQNEKGELFKIKASGFLARVIQHEYDHLEGILFIDKLKPGTKLITKEEYITLKNSKAGERAK